MKSICLIIGFFLSVSPSYADSFRTDGETYTPDAPVVWGATNDIPTSIGVYKVVPQAFSNQTMSNVLAIASFTSKTMMLSKDKKTMQWRLGSQESLRRALDIKPALGWIKYADAEAIEVVIKAPPKGVPSFEEVDNLALKCLMLVGGDTNQLSWHPISRTRQYGSITDTNGHLKFNYVSMRGVMFARQIDGIRISGPCGRGGFSIEFGSNAKVAAFELCWRKYQPYKRYNTASPSKILEWVKGRQAVRPENSKVPTKPNKLTITKITPYYWGEIGEAPQDFVEPYATLDVVADLGGTNTAQFTLDCPILDTEIK